VDDWDPSADGREMLIVSGSGTQPRTRVMLEPTTGWQTSIASGSALSRQHEKVIGGGFLNSEGLSTLRTNSVATRKDTTFDLSATYGYLLGATGARDARSAVVVGWNLKADSLIVSRLDLLTGAMRALAHVYSEGGDDPVRLPDGNVLVAVHRASDDRARDVPVRERRTQRSGAAAGSAPGRVCVAGSGGGVAVTSGTS